MQRLIEREVRDRLILKIERHFDRGFPEKPIAIFVVLLVTTFFELKYVCSFQYRKIASSNFITLLGVGSLLCKQKSLKVAKFILLARSKKKSLSTSKIR